MTGPDATPLMTMRFVIRTPHGIVCDQPLQSARLPTETGQVGLRPRSEPTLLAVEAGLILLKHSGGTSYAATAGGLVRVEREQTTLYTPFAVVGESAASVSKELERAHSDPTGELSAHRKLEDLELRILEELHRVDTRRTPLGKAHG